MKATVSRADLANAARWVSGAVSKNPSMPVLAGMVVTALENRTGPRNAGMVALEAFDYDNALRAMVEAEVNEPGRCLVSGHTFAGFLGSVNGDLVELTDVVSNRTLHILTEATSATFLTLPEREYPAIPKMAATPFATFEADQLSAAVKRIASIPAARFDSPEAIDRPWAASFLLSTGEGALILQACTPYAAGEVAIEVDLLHQIEGTLVVPSAGFLAALSAMSGEVGLAVDGSNLVMHDDTRAASLRTLDDAKVPAVASVLSVKPSGEFTVDLSQIRAAVKLVSTVTDRVVLTVDENRLKVTTTQPTKGELVVNATSELAATSNTHGVIHAGAGRLSGVLAGMSDDPTFNFDPERVGRVAVTDHHARYVFQAVRPI